MAIKVKAVERKLKFNNDPENQGEYRYIMSAEIYSKLSQNKVIQEAALRSGLTRGALNAAWEAIGEVIKAWTTEGHWQTGPPIQMTMTELDKRRSDDEADSRSTVWSAVVFYTTFIVSLILMATGFLTPQFGVIDGSVLTASGILLMFAAIAKTHDIFGGVRNGQSIRLQKGDFKAEVTSAND